MRVLLLSTVVFFILLMNACIHPHEQITPPTMNGRIGVGEDYKIKWHEWTPRGIGWAIDNEDGSKTIVMPLQFIGKTLPTELRQKAQSFDKNQIDQGVLMFMTTMKDSTIISTKTVIELPEKYKLKNVVEKKSSARKSSKPTLSDQNLMQQVCTDFYYQVCTTSGGCEPPVFSYTSCETVNTDDGITYNPGLVNGGGGVNNPNAGIVFANEPEGKHGSNQRFVFGKLQCSSLSFRPIPQTQLPGNQRYEVGITNLLLIYPNGRRYTINDLYISVPRSPGGVFLTPRQMATAVAGAFDGCAASVLNRISTDVRATFVLYLDIYIAATLNIDQSAVEIRDYNATDQSRGVIRSIARYVTPYTRYEPCDDTKPD